MENKRITYKCICPNPLFQKWLEELLQEAETKKSKLTSKLNEALKSLSKYPLPLETGAECAILQGFDRRLCLFLDKRLEVYKSPEVPSVQFSTANTSRSEDPNDMTQNCDSASDSTKSNSPVKKTSRKPYKPLFRSGGYAILITLLEQFSLNPENPRLCKEELIEKAQNNCEESFTRPKPGSHYTAWSNMPRLIIKGLVMKIKNKKFEYYLTEQGIELAKELLQETKTKPTNNDFIFYEATISNQEIIENTSLVETTIRPSTPVVNSSSGYFIEFAAGSFDIILLIDKNEISGAAKKNDPTVAQFNKYPNLKHEYRSLKVGDFTWVARHKTDKKKELILPYIVERKRMDDLGASIKDGRFHEQKFRLRKCGIPNVIYLIESYGENKGVGLPLNSLMQALANTRVQDGFKVHMVNGLANCARFLAMMSKRLTIEYEHRDLKGTNTEPEGDKLMSFEFFNKASAKSKTLTVTETFIKLLLQLKGMSVEKALAITKSYNTPRSLIEAYQKCNMKEGEFLLANLKYGTDFRNVGPSVSRTIYQFFTNKDLI